MTHHLVQRFLDENPKWNVQTKNVDVPCLDGTMSYKVLTGTAKFAFIRWAVEKDIVSIEKAKEIVGISK